MPNTHCRDIGAAEIAFGEDHGRHDAVYSQIERASHHSNAEVESEVDSRLQDVDDSG